MRICIDIQSAIAQRAGVGRYTKLLVQHLSDLVVENEELMLFFFDFMKKGVPFDAGKAVSKPVRWCPGRLAQLAWKKLGWPPFDFFAEKADVYHFPNFILPPLSQGKTVVTIHDMSFIRFPEFAEERNKRFLTARIQDTVKRADAIIADSEFSANEIKELLNVDESKIHPVHLGIEESFKAPSEEGMRSSLSVLGLNKPYILTVGTLEPRKNIPFLIEAFEKLSGFDGDLVIAGMPGWKYEPILERMKNSKKAGSIRYLSYVPEEHLPALYAGADLFALTSRYEGFGFPPLESMACGTPVVSSSCGSLAEVLGDAAVLINEFDSDLWAEEMKKVLTDSQLKEKLVAQGYSRSAEYSWSKAAQRTLEVYRRIV